MILDRILITIIATCFIPSVFVFAAFIAAYGVGLIGFGGE